MAIETCRNPGPRLPALRSGDWLHPQPAPKGAGTAIPAEFSQVRIHDDRESSELAQGIGARAFTLRNHIFFNRGEFAPNTRRGRWLLAHELAHVAQQARSPGEETIRRAINFRDNVDSVKTKVVDRDGTVRDSRALIDEFIAGLEVHFGIVAKKVKEGDVVIVTIERQVVGFVDELFKSSRFVKWLGDKAAQKVLVPKPRGPGEAYERIRAEDDFTAVDLDLAKERYLAVREALISRLQTGNLNVERSTTTKGRSESIRYQEKTYLGWGEKERVEVTPELYKDIVIFERSGWSGFWILTHEILHGAGRRDDEAGIINAGKPVYLTTRKTIDMRDANNPDIRLEDGERAWTSVGQPEYDLNMARLIVGKPLRLGYSDAIGGVDSVRFSENSAPVGVGAGKGSSFSVVPGAPAYEFIGAEMSGGERRLARQEFEGKAREIEVREARLWLHILRQGHPGEFGGRPARFHFFGSGMRQNMIVERVGAIPKTYETELVVDIAQQGQEPVVTNLRLALNDGGTANMVTLGTDSGESYRSTMAVLTQGAETISGKVEGFEVTVRLYAPFRR